MMEAARTSETLVNFYQTTRCYNPEDSHLHTHRRENLNSYLHFFFFLQSVVVHSDNKFFPGFPVFLDKIHNWIYLELLENIL
jgi:hypothetical protein